MVKLGLNSLRREYPNTNPQTRARLMTLDFNSSTGEPIA